VALVVAIIGVSSSLVAANQATKFLIILVIAVLVALWEISMALESSQAYIRVTWWK